MRTSVSPSVKGHRQAQFSLGCLLVSEADGNAGLMGAGGRSPMADVGLARHCPPARFGSPVAPQLAAPPHVTPPLSAPPPVAPPLAARHLSRPHWPPHHLSRPLEAACQTDRPDRDYDLTK
jgi:hypothetical protein